MDGYRISHIVLYSVVLIGGLTMIITVGWNLATGFLPMTFYSIGLIGIGFWIGIVGLRRLYWWIFEWPRLDDFGRQNFEP